MIAKQFGERLVAIQDNLLSFALILTSNRDDAYDLVQDSYSVVEITDVINSFSDEYRVPFSMHLAGYKYQEIADSMHLPVGTIKSRIFFARKRLRRDLDDYRVRC